MQAKKGIVFGWWNVHLIESFLHNRYQNILLINGLPSISQIITTELPQKLISVSAFPELYYDLLPGLHSDVTLFSLVFIQ